MSSNVYYSADGIVRDGHGAGRYENLPTTVIEMLHRASSSSPDREAIVEYQGARVSYKRLHAMAAECAGGLRQHGIKPGDRVAIAMANSLEWVVAYLGVTLCGGVAVPINTRLNQPEINHLLEHCGASLVLDDPADLPRAEHFVATDVKASDLASIFYTSGTTGPPKGVMLSHDNIVQACESQRRNVAMALGSEKAYCELISVPLFHVTGCNSQLLATILAGGTSVILPKFTVADFLGAVSVEKVEVLVGVATMYWRALNDPGFAHADFSSVKAALYGGAPTPPEVIDKIKTSIPGARLANGYGATETGSVVCSLPHEYIETHNESVGMALPVVDIKLVEADSTGIGELVVRSPGVAAGYWGNVPSPVRDGWYYTGDLARIDEDGFVYLMDRKKDMISRGGEKVYCVEVENILAAAPGVFEIAVCGVPDLELGERIGVAVVPVPHQRFDADAFMDYARAHLAKFMWPEYVVVVDEALPRNAGGKVVKSALRHDLSWSSALRPVSR